MPALQGDVQRCPAGARGHLLRPYPTSDLARVLGSGGGGGGGRDGGGGGRGGGGRRGDGWVVCQV